jgi:hypothetical protein
VAADVEHELGGVGGAVGVVFDEDDGAAEGVEEGDGRRIFVLFGFDARVAFGVACVEVFTLFPPEVSFFEDGVVLVVGGWGAPPRRRAERAGGFGFFRRFGFARGCGSAPPSPPGAVLARFARCGRAGGTRVPFGGRATLELLRCRDVAMARERLMALPATRRTSGHISGFVSIDAHQ